MAGRKLIVSGLSEPDVREFHALVDAVGEVITPALRRSLDASVLARFAINSIVSEHRSDPGRLARALGFEVRG